MGVPYMGVGWLVIKSTSSLYQIQCGDSKEGFAINKKWNHESRFAPFPKKKKKLLPKPPPQNGSLPKSPNRKCGAQSRSHSSSFRIPAIFSGRFGGRIGKIPLSGVENGEVNTWGKFFIHLWFFLDTHEGLNIKRCSMLDAFLIKQKKCHRFFLLPPVP